MVKVLHRYITHIPYAYIKIPPSEKNKTHLLFILFVILCLGSTPLKKFLYVFHSFPTYDLEKSCLARYYLAHSL